MSPNDAVALYQKINITRITIYVESFIIVSQSAQNVHYAALLVYMGFVISNQTVRSIV